jgi:hypothetical protein
MIHARVADVKVLVTVIDQGGPVGSLREALIGGDCEPMVEHLRR